MKFIFKKNFVPKIGNGIKFILKIGHITFLSDNDYTMFLLSFKKSNDVFLIEDIGDYRLLKACSLKDQSKLAYINLIAHNVANYILIKNKKVGLNYFINYAYKHFNLQVFK
jgi:hypothetical protein